MLFLSCLLSVIFVVRGVTVWVGGVTSTSAMFRIRAAGAPEAKFLLVEESDVEHNLLARERAVFSAALPAGRSATLFTAAVSCNSMIAGTITL